MPHRTMPASIRQRLALNTQIRQITPPKVYRTRLTRTLASAAHSSEIVAMREKPMIRNCFVPSLGHRASKRF